MKNVCDNCGTKLNRKDVICSHCGNVIIKDEEKEKNKKLLLIVALSVVVLLISGIVVGKLVFNNNTADTADALTKNTQNGKETPQDIFKNEATDKQTNTTQKTDEIVSGNKSSKEIERIEDYISDQYLLDCGDKDIYVDQNGVWVYNKLEKTTRNIVKCNAMGLVSNGEKIYYGKYNSEVDGEYGTYMQYDLYCVNVDGSDNKKVFSGMGDIQPVYVTDEKLYYCDYDSDYYSTSPAGLSRNLYFYDFKTKEKKLVAKEANTAQYYNSKIYYGPIIVAGFEINAQIKSYDIKTKKIEQVTEESALQWVFENGKLIYYGITGFDKPSKICILDLKTGKKSTVFEDIFDMNKSYLGVMLLDADKVCYYISNYDQYDFYVYDVKAQETTKVKGAKQTPLQAIVIDNSLYFYDNIFQNELLVLYPYNDNDATIGEGVAEYHGRDILGISGHRVYVVEGDNYYKHNINVYEFE